MSTTFTTPEKLKNIGKKPDNTMTNCLVNFLFVSVYHTKYTSRHSYAGVCALWNALKVYYDLYSNEFYLPNSIIFSFLRLYKEFDYLPCTCALNHKQQKHLVCVLVPCKKNYIYYKTNQV